MRVVVLLVVTCVACTKTNPLDCADGTCSDPMHPYCDKDGAIGGTANSCIAVSCSAPSAFVECKGDTAVSCNSTSDGYVLTPCTMGCADAAQGCNMCTPNGSYCTAAGVQHCGSDGAPSTLDPCSTGCSMDPAPHCEYLEPRYLGDICATAATDDLSVGSNASLGTDLDAICTGGVLHQTAAPDICVVRNKTITIAAAATLRVTGTRLLALVADDELDIHGTLDASADVGTPGPGACDRSSGGSYGATDGGGGAGFKTAGGPGGSATTDGGAANGGAVETDPAQLAVFVGGPCSGGGGGAGGGGVTLVACRGTVSVDGMIDLGGGGGLGGTKPLSLSNAGRGGGAGGYLVIQAFNIVLTGALYANGGGGGAGYTSSANGRTGGDGSRSSTVGATGGTVQGGEGAGGDGGFGTNAGAQGDHPGGTGKAGGGGGGVGFLQTYTPSGVTPTLTPSDVSPPLQPNQTIPTN